MKFVPIALVVAIALFFVPELHAQGGCIDSPENPTVILALVGTAAAYLSGRMKLPRKK